ncbi:hypothetical protein Ddc_12332 [Ditylenchus destructor]|nr:hypothetical protein Ddc_12332 [Ditylenchus destructor]
MIGAPHCFNITSKFGVPTVVATHPRMAAEWALPVSESQDLPVTSIPGPALFLNHVLFLDLTLFMNSIVMDPALFSNSLFLNTLFLDPLYCIVAGKKGNHLEEPASLSNVCFGLDTHATWHR